MSQVRWPRCPCWENLGNTQNVPKECICRVSEWIIQGFPCSFLNCAITVFPAWKIQNVLNKWTKNVPEWHTQNALSNYPRCALIGKIWGNLWEILSTCWGNWKTGNILNVLRISHKFPQNLPIRVHLGQFDRTFWMCHSGTFLVHSLGTFWIFQAGNTVIAQFRKL